MEKILLDNMTGQEIKEMIDNELVSLQELTDSALEKVLDFETEMICHGSGDMEIIRRCSELLDQRSKSNKLNAAEISDIINKTKAEHVTVVDVGDGNSTAAPRRMRFVLKRIAVVAAAIMIMLTATVSIAAAFDIDVTRYLKSIMKEPDGTVIHADGMSIYNGKNPTLYYSVEELLEAEKVDIMYPTVFPESVTFKHIAVGEHPPQNNKYVSFRVDDVWVGVTIELDLPEFTTTNPNTYEHNGITYYVDTCKGGWFATCYYNNNQYFIGADSYDDLKLIIDNMKE